MSPRPLLLFVAAIALAAAGTAAGIALFSDSRADADRDRLQSEAFDLAVEAVTWARTPALLGGGDGTRALRQLDLKRLGTTPGRDADGEFLAREGATLRFRDLDTDTPSVLAANADGSLAVRLAVLGPDTACITPVELEADLDGDSAPEGCASWR